MRLSEEGEERKTKRIMALTPETTERRAGAPSSASRRRTARALRDLPVLEPLLPGLRGRPLARFGRTHAQCAHRCDHRALRAPQSSCSRDAEVHA